jgi:hypothetical protein
VFRCFLVHVPYYLLETLMLLLSLCKTEYGCEPVDIPLLVKFSYYFLELCITEVLVLGVVLWVGVQGTCDA